MNGSATVADFSPRASQRARARHGRRVHLRRAGRQHDRRRPPRRVVLRLRRRPLLVHGDGPHRGLVRRRELPQPPARRPAHRRRRRPPTAASRAQTAPAAADFEKVTLDDDTNAPMEIDIANDGRVFYIELDGRVTDVEPDHAAPTTTAGTIPVSSRPRERPDRHPARARLRRPPATSTWRTTRCPTTTSNGMGEPRLALHGHGQHVVAGSEQIIYTWQHQRAECCHTGGSLDFGPTAASTSPRATTRTRSPTASTRSTSGPAARAGTPSARRPTRTTRTARSCASSRSRTPTGAPGHRDDVHDPGRQHVPGRHGADAARDLRDGLPQPVPDPRRPRRPAGC